MPEASISAPIRPSDRIRGIGFAVATGCIFIWFNFNGLIRHYTKAYWAVETKVSAAVMFVSLLPKQILSPSAETLYLWMVACFVGLWVYVASILLLTVVRGRWSLAKWGIGGAVGGGLALPALCWTALITWGILRFLASVARFIGHALAVLFTWIAKGLIFAAPVLLVIAIVVAFVWAWKEYGPKLVVPIVGGAGLLYLLMPVFRWLLSGLEWLLEKIAAFFVWIGEILARLFSWLGPVIAWCLKGLAVLLGITTVVGIIGCIGHLLIDQLKVAAQAGKSQKALFATSFSIGVSFALVLLVAAGQPEGIVLPVSSGGSTSAPSRMLLGSNERPSLAKRNKRRKKKRRAQKAQPSVVETVIAPIAPPIPPPVDVMATIDRAWSGSTFVFKSLSPARAFHAVLPGAVREWARTTFQPISAPTFDAVLLVVALVFAICGLWRGIFFPSEIEYNIRFYNSDLLLIATIPLLVVLLVLSASAENQE